MPLRNNVILILASLIKAAIRKLLYYLLSHIKGGKKRDHYGSESGLTVLSERTAHPGVKPYRHLSNM